MLVAERWKPIPGYGEHYMASNLGRIMSKERVVEKKHKCGRMIKQTYAARVLNPHVSDSEGHLSVHLGVDGQKFLRAVHRSVLQAFKGPCPVGMEGCHRDGNGGNNKIRNLRWDTHFKNNQDRKRHGRYACGDKHHMAKFSNAQRRKIAKMTIKEALVFGASKTHYYRLRRTFIKH